MVFPISRKVEKSLYSRIIDILDNFGRYSPYDCICRNIFRYYRTGSHHRIIANRYPLQDSGIGTDPYIFTKHDRCRIGGMAVFRYKSVVERCKNHVVPYLATVTQRNAAVVLEMAAGIDEHIITDFDIFPEIRIKRRKHTERRRNGFPEKLGQQCPYLVRSMIGSIQPKCDTPCLIAHFIHKKMYIFRIEGFPCLYIF